MWEPDFASEQIERDMESLNLPETDRDEIRRFAEFLRRVDAKRKGQALPPPPEGMKAWLQGKE